MRSREPRGGPYGREGGWCLAVRRMGHVPREGLEQAAQGPQARRHPLVLPPALDADLLGHSVAHGPPARRRAEPEHQAPQRARRDHEQGRRRQRVLYGGGRASQVLRTPLGRDHPDRRGDRQDGQRAPGAEQADPRVEGNSRQDRRLALLSRHPDLRGRHRPDDHALDGRPDLRQHVQRHGCRIARHHQVRRRHVGVRGQVRPLYHRRHGRRDDRDQKIQHDRIGPSEFFRGRPGPADGSAS